MKNQASESKPLTTEQILKAELKGLQQSVEILKIQIRRKHFAAAHDTARDIKRAGEAMASATKHE